MISYFSRRNFTRDTDRLTAPSGLAQAVVEHESSRKTKGYSWYIAGRYATSDFRYVMHDLVLDHIVALIEVSS